MKRFMRAALVAIPAALLAYAPAQRAEAHPLVAVGWLWAAGAGGLLLGFLGGNAYAAQHAPVYAAPPVVAPPQPASYESCRNVTVRYRGQWRHAQICD